MIANLTKIVYSWISFHGITDIFLPLKLWAPIYSLSLLSIFMPMNLLNIITFILSGIHFQYDIYLHLVSIYCYLFALLAFGEYKLSQDIILVYMSLIHVPLHLFRIIYDFNTMLVLFLSFLSIYNFPPLIELLDLVIKSGGRSPANYSHKMILGFINAHILTNICEIKSYAPLL